MSTVPAADIIATDPNPAMVSWAVDRITGTTWRQADAQALQHPDASFDLVVCQFGVMFVPDKRTAFAEAARRLRPGGTLLVWDAAETSRFPAALIHSLAAVLPDNPPSSSSGCLTATPIHSGSRWTYRPAACSR